MSALIGLAAAGVSPNLPESFLFSVGPSGTRKIDFSFWRYISNENLGRPEFPTTIATKEGQPMPTPNDIKRWSCQNSETYPETLAGKVQFANRTHVGRLCSTQPPGCPYTIAGQTTQKIRYRRTTEKTEPRGIFTGHIRVGKSHCKFPVSYQER